MSNLASFFYQVHEFYFQKIFSIRLKREYELQQFDLNERIIEYAFVLKSLQKIRSRTILDVGTGKTALPHLLSNCGFIVTAIDNIYDYWSVRLFNRHFYIINDDITNPQITKKFDCITCISTLEHIKNYNKAVFSIFRLLKKGGYLILTFPYNEKIYIDNVYKLPEATFGRHVKYVCRMFSRKELNFWLKINKGKIINQEYWQVWDGHLWTFGNFLKNPKKVNKNTKHQLTCILIRKNN